MHDKIVTRTRQKKFPFKSKKNYRQGLKNKEEEAKWKGGNSSKWSIKT
jgi:hypothetical protein